MGSFDAAQQYIRRTTHAYAREMIPGVPVRVQFEDYPDGTLAETIPSYRIDGRGKFYDFLFIIKYDIDFVRSNQANITSEGVRGVIVHELAHAKQFMQDQTFTAYPHRNRKFRDAVTEHAATLNLRNPKLHALAVAKEDYRCYLHRYRDPKNEDLPPRWLLHFWVFACPNCGTGGLRRHRSAAVLHEVQTRQRHCRPPPPVDRGGFSEECEIRIEKELAAIGDHPDYHRVFEKISSEG